MKTFIKVFLPIISFILLVPQNVMSQEYDDMYFMPQDRKKVKFESSSENDSRETYEAYQNDRYSDNYSTHQVNPDYIARYQSGVTQEDYQEPENPNYGTPSASSIEYFEEPSGQGQTIINNYYGGSTQGLPMQVNSGFGVNPWTWNSAFSIGFNTGFSPAWGWNQPWIDPFWGPGFGLGVSPFYWNGFWGNPVAGGFGFYDPWWGWNSGWGWNRWNRINAFGRGFNTGFAYCYGGYNVYAPENVLRRNVVRSGRVSRGGLVTGTSRVSNRASTRVVSNSSRSGGSISRTDSRDHTRSQNEYFNQSRRTATATNRSRSSNSNVAQRATRTSNSSRTVSSSSGRNSGTSRRYSSSNNSNRNYSTGTSRSRSSSTNSSGRSYRSGSSNRTSGTSRSYSSGSTSRSSGSSRSYSSGSSSRSSSSFSRSSSGSSSRSSGSRSSSSRSGGSSRRGGGR